MAMAQAATIATFVVVLVALVLCLVAQTTTAFQFSVGGGNGWTVPSNANTFSEWAHRSRFQIGDSLVFKYQTDQDAVLYVNQDSYDNCKTDTYIAKYADGHTVFTFNQSGPFHFISGNKDHCLKNQKLVVVVLADRSSNSTSPPPPPPSASPTPAPAGEGSPSPPPEVASAPAAEVTPPPSPAKSGTASLVVGFVGTVLPSYVLLLL